MSIQNVTAYQTQLIPLDQENEDKLIEDSPPGNTTDEEIKEKTLLDLPPETILLILDRLSIEDRTRFGMTCHTAMNLADSSLEYRTRRGVAQVEWYEEREKKRLARLSALEFRCEHSLGRLKKRRKRKKTAAAILVVPSAVNGLVTIGLGAGFGGAMGLPLLFPIVFPTGLIVGKLAKGDWGAYAETAFRASQVPGALAGAALGAGVACITTPPILAMSTITSGSYLIGEAIWYKKRKRSIQKKYDSEVQRIQNLPSREIKFAL